MGRKLKCTNCTELAWPCEQVWHEADSQLSGSPSAKTGGSRCTLRSIGSRLRPDNPSAREGESA